MNHTLLLLLKLRARAACRKIVRTLRRPKGALLAVFGLAFISLMLLPNLLMHRQNVPKVDSFMITSPIALFGFWLATLSSGRNSHALVFSPAEIDFLFPGPFSRRELIGYKLVVIAIGALGTALMLPIFIGQFKLWWPAVLLGVWLVFMFIQYLSVVATLAIGSLAERFPRWWIALVGVIVAVIAVSAWQSGALADDLKFLDRLRAIAQTSTVQVIVAPFSIFSALIRAATIGQLAGWGSAAVAADAVTVALVLWMDANFLEASLGASKRRYEWLQRARQRGGMVTLSVRSKPRFGLPQFPRLGGAGTIAWRQALELVRNSAWLLIVFPLIVAMAAPAVFSGSAHGAPVAVLMMTFMIGFFMTLLMPMGLRADLPHAEVLKSLPLSPLAIVWGSITAAVLHPTLVQVAAICLLSALVREWTWAATLAVTFAMPLNLLFVCVDSVMVLLYPSTAQLAPGDFLAGTRMMFAYLVKILFIVVAGLVAGAAAFLAGLVSGESHFVMGAVGWIVMVAEGAAVITLAAVLFERFDPSMDAIAKE